MATVYRVTRIRHIYEAGRTPADGGPDEVDLDTRWYTATRTEITDAARVAALETVLQRSAGHPSPAQVAALVTAWREAGVTRYEIDRVEEGPKTLTYRYVFDVSP